MNELQPKELNPLAMIAQAIEKGFDPDSMGN